jgi:hypothetical protein
MVQWQAVGNAVMKLRIRLDTYIYIYIYIYVYIAQMAGPSRSFCLCRTTEENMGIIVYPAGFQTVDRTPLRTSGQCTRVSQMKTVKLR